MAKYHLDSREDPKIEQLKFFEFLNENFFIISARRSNVFEQAISWCIHGESKKLNVHSVSEKEITFSKIYEHGIQIDPRVLEHYLNVYVEYENWSSRHFNISAHFYYDQNFENIEEYILKLNPFAEIKDKKPGRIFLT